MQTTELSVGKQGRIVIPANLRHQLAIEPGRVGNLFCPPIQQTIKKIKLSNENSCKHSYRMLRLKFVEKKPADQFNANTKNIKINLSNETGVRSFRAILLITFTAYL